MKTTGVISFGTDGESLQKTFECLDHQTLEHQITD